ncbi:hypothetical protein RvY_07857 [Ramazzottius varieornatus]|uniref:Gustatory receptor n=1 Tax=Ramazzottius varieornatus TaxID=947166 RepID=A0A1D1V6L5_RAMVA|nr:hypothetical protein RvY_07857 [Ramazzottius varieornatus]
MENHISGLEPLAEDPQQLRCNHRSSPPDGGPRSSLSHHSIHSRKRVHLDGFLAFFRWFCLIRSKEDDGLCDPSFLSALKKVLLHLYFFLFVLHSLLYILELILIFVFAAATRDSSVDSLRNLIYNSRYSFMVIKSLLLFSYFRPRSDSIVKLTAALEEQNASRSSNFKQNIAVLRKLWILAIGVITVTFLIAFAWEILDWSSWGTGFHETWQQDVEIALFGRKLKVWILCIFWYSLGTPINLCMNLAMVFFAELVLTLYLNWREMNKRLTNDPLYLTTEFRDDWEHLRQLAEQADDIFSAMVFVSWASDIVLSVGYLGSVIIYGAGNPREQAYTLLGLFIHAMWYPAIYLVPCILFDEEILRTRQIVVGTVHEEVRSKELASPSLSNNTSTSSLLLLNITLQNMAFRPVAFTAWKFFYITRNVILTIATVLLSYALVLIQLVGRKQDGTPTAQDGFGLSHPNSTLGTQ